MLVMVRRKPGLTLAEFRDGYENSHSRIAVELFGHLWLSYHRNYIVSARRFGAGMGAGAAAAAADPGFDAVSEYVLRDEAALDEMGRIAMANFQRIKEDESLWRVPEPDGCGGRHLPLRTAW
jgi:hypothetical protein